MLNCNSFYFFDNNSKFIKKYLIKLFLSNPFTKIFQSHLSRDAKMRKSVTNLLIINLALADVVIMLFGIPETVMFVAESGWILGEIMCKINR